MCPAPDRSYPSCSHVPGRTVYLFELDSTRNSENESRLGKEALFLALLSGENVVISCNQLADSQVMLELLGPKDVEFTRDQILKLVSMGRIRIGRYRKSNGDICRTFSQYVQESFSKNNSFISSRFPQLRDLDENHPLFSCIAKMLMYSDPNRIYDHDDMSDEALIGNGFAIISSEDRDEIHAFVDLLLELSRTAIYVDPRADENRLPLSRCMDILCGHLATNPQAADVLGVSRSSLDSAVELTLSAEATAIAEAAANGASEIGRSAVFRILAEDNGTDRGALRIAVAITDISYNVAVESSLDGIDSRHTPDGDATIQILRNYLVEHDFSEYCPTPRRSENSPAVDAQDDALTVSGKQADTDADKPILAWKSVARLSRMPDYDKRFNAATGEPSDDMRQALWTRNMRGNIWRAFRRVALSALIAICFSLSSWLVSGWEADLATGQGWSLGVRLVVEIVVLTAIFDYIGSRFELAGSTDVAHGARQMIRDMRTRRLWKHGRCNYIKLARDERER